MNGHEILLHIAGGVALLLWGARMVRTGILRAYGARLRRAIGRSTRNRVVAALVGLASAGLLQSSTATALLAASFAQRGLIATGAGLAVMLGADVGSTLVVQALSFDLSAAVPVLILVGVIAFTSGPRSTIRQLGRVSIGLGLMLIALRMVVDASQVLRESETMPLLLAPLGSDPILAVLFAALLSWLFHSSVAMVLLVGSFAAAGIVDPPLAFALVLGANIGAGIVPLVISLSEDRLARRIPLGNLVFRTLGALAVLTVLPAVTPLVAELGGDPARQIANFHTLFNIALAVACLPVTGFAARVVDRLLPEAPPPDDAGQPRYLDDDAIASPPDAIARAIRETLRLADIAESMLVDVITVFEKDDETLMRVISDRDDAIDRLHEAIKLYLARIDQTAMSPAEFRRSVELLTFVTHLEHVGDIIDRNLLPLAHKKMRIGVSFPPEAWEELVAMHRRAVDQFALAITVLVSHDLDSARRLVADKDALRVLELDASASQIDRLRGGDAASLEAASLHLDILRELKRIVSHVTSIGYPLLESAGELRHSRLKQPVREPEVGAGGSRGGAA